MPRLSIAQLSPRPQPLLGFASPYPNRDPPLLPIFPGRAGCGPTSRAFVARRLHGHLGDFSRWTHSTPRSPALRMSTCPLVTSRRTAAGQRLFPQNGRLSACKAQNLRVGHGNSRGVQRVVLAAETPLAYRCQARHSMLTKHRGRPRRDTIAGLGRPSRRMCTTSTNGKACRDP